MSTMAVIFTRPVPARHFLGALVWMSTISFSVQAIPRLTSRSAPLLSSAHQGVACPVTVHPFCLRSHHAELGMPWDSCCCRPARQHFPFCIMNKFRIRRGMRSPRREIWLCAGTIRRVTRMISLRVRQSTEHPAYRARRHFHCLLDHCVLSLCRPRCACVCGVLPPGRLITGAHPYCVPCTVSPAT